jgi:hypothetical protein
MQTEKQVGGAFVVVTLKHKLPCLFEMQGTGQAR